MERKEKPDMKYELTKDLETGNTLIDSEHCQLFAAVNSLMDACQTGQGRSKIESTAKFLDEYVKKHFGDEEKLQKSSKYPAYTTHKLFHDNYIRQLDGVCRIILKEGATIANLSRLNYQVGVLVNHIRTEDKKLAAHLKAANK